MSDSFSVTRQRVNCGPTQTIYTESRDEAVRAFDLAVADNDQFVTLYNETQDFEVLRHLKPMKRLSDLPIFGWAWGEDGKDLSA